MRTSVSSRSKSARLLAVSAAALLLGSGLAACGAAKSEALSKSDADSALLTQANLGDSFKIDTSSDDKSSAPGCLKDLDAKTKAPVEAKRDFEADNENGLPSVGSEVASYKNKGAAENAMSSARTAIDKCTSVNYTEDSATTKLTITNDDKTTVDGADEQLNIIATGTVSADGQEFPITLSFSAVRVKNDVAIVTVGDLAADSSKDLATYLKAAVGRLVAVQGGKSPSDAVISTAHALTADQAQSAALAVGNLGGDFQADTTADHSTPSPGCLTAIDAITDNNDAPVHYTADFDVAGGNNFPLVSNTVASYDSEADAKAALEKLRTDISTCTSVDETDSGVTTKLTVATDDTKTSADSDDQVDIQAVGTISQARTSPLWLGVVAVREDNNLTIVLVGDLAKKAPGDIPSLVKTVDGRLVAVMAGQTPSDAPIGS